MAELTDNIQTKINEAMKARDSLRVSTLRMLSSELHNQQIEMRQELTEEEELAVVRREAKKRRDAIEAYENANRPDRAESEKAELAILSSFLPAPLTTAETEKLIDDAVAETGAGQPQDFGRVMGNVMSKAEGRAEPGEVSRIIRARLA